MLLKLKKFLNSWLWNNSLLNEKTKLKLLKLKRDLFGTKYLQGNSNIENDNEFATEYVKQIMDSQFLDNSFSINYPKLEDAIKLKPTDPKLLAFYLPQYRPNKYNDLWWGKGTTEWTNVGKSVPQYLGHYQPRCPGELGYYDLRVKENIYRQIELAKIFGIYGFCCYYYWFDGTRLLHEPLNEYINDKSIDFPFCICWANENWSQQWNGISNAPLISQSKSEKSYKNFIESCFGLFNKDNYIKINGKPLLIVYRPDNMPTIKPIIDFWRQYVKQNLNIDLYISAVYRENIDLLFEGFDAVNEFAPNLFICGNNPIAKNITNTKKYASKYFFGHIYDYKEFVDNKHYFDFNYPKTFRAICPMFDNTARKKQKALVFDGSTPNLYKQWLKDIIIETKQRVANKELDDNIIFVNAWNEWAEGAYLEPDLYWKYGYLEATRDAILETRN